jgi:hypothetical protein
MEIFAGRKEFILKVLAQIKLMIKKGFIETKTPLKPLTE